MKKRFLAIALAFVMMFSIVGVVGCANIDNMFEYCCPQYTYEHGFCLTVEVSETSFTRNDTDSINIVATLKNLTRESHYISTSFLFSVQIEGRGVLIPDVIAPFPTQRYFEANSYIVENVGLGGAEFLNAGSFKLTVVSVFWFNFQKYNEKYFSFRSHTITLNVRR